jgi:hypothetical protein
MSINLLSAFGSGVKLDHNAEKDAQQKAEEIAASAFASLLTKPNVPTDAASAKDITVITGQRSNTVIPAVLIDASASDPVGAESAAAVNAATHPTDATEEFLDFARKSPAEKMRAMVLSEMGLTEEALRALDSDARAVVEAKIQTQIEAKIRQEMEKKSGAKLDLASPAIINALS